MRNTKYTEQHLFGPHTLNYGYFFVLASSPYDGMPAKLPRILHDPVDIVSTNIGGDLWPGAGLTRYIVDDVLWEFPLLRPIAIRLVAVLVDLSL